MAWGLAPTPRIGFEDPRQVHSTMARKFGTNAANLLKGTNFSDEIHGRSGNDKIYGYAGSDYLDGGTGHDQLFGGNDNDTLLGYTGNDKLYGEAGNDELLGEADNDLLNGGTGHDFLDGGAHNDTLIGATGDDTLAGGSGFDELVFGALHGDDLVLDFDLGIDAINLRALGYSHISQLYDYMSDVYVDDGFGLTLSTEIATGDGFITLVGVDQLDLTNGDFVFA